MKGLYKQRGVSFTGWLVIALIAGFFLTIALKLGPHYLDNMTINQALQQLGQESKTKTLSLTEARRTLDRIFIVNNVRERSANELQMTREKGNTILTFSYEERIEFMGNVDVILKFDNVYDSSQGD